MAASKETPSQTAGPYVHIGCAPVAAGLGTMFGGVDPGAEMLTGDPGGRRIAFTGTVRDGEGQPVTDALVEVWHADADGTYGRNPAFTGWGRQRADPETGLFRFDTIKPGRTKGGGQAPHVLIWIVARGINLGLMTRAYFPDEPNDGDPVLALAGPRGHTMIARKVPDGYHLDIALQGPDETVFLDA